MLAKKKHNSNLGRMKMKTRRNPTNLAAMIMFALVIVIIVDGQIAAAVYDDFNGTHIDQMLWHIENTDGVLSQSDGHLHANSPPNSTQGVIISKIILYTALSKN